jgi:hypothetical protein
MALTTLTCSIGLACDPSTLSACVEETEGFAVDMSSLLFKLF